MAQMASLVLLREATEKLKRSPPVIRRNAAMTEKNAAVIRRNAKDARAVMTKNLRSAMAKRVKRRSAMAKMVKELVQPRRSEHHASLSPPEWLRSQLPLGLSYKSVCDAFVSHRCSL